MPELSIVQEAAGCAHTVLLLSDGTVWTAGPSGSPRPVDGLRDVTAVGAGSVHSLALTRDGTLWAWGLPGTSGAPVPVPDCSALYAPLAFPRQRRLDFGGEQLGRRSRVRTLVLTNVGLEPLQVSGAEITGEHAGDFRLVSDCCASVEIYPGSACSLDFAFRPTGAGWRQAEITILDNGLARPVTVELAGYGAGADLLGDCPDDLRVRFCDLVPIRLEAAGSHCGARVTCGRQEWATLDGCERRLRQEFLIEVPVAVDLYAQCGCEGASTQARSRFTAVQSVWAELPVAFGADLLHDGSCKEPWEDVADCCFTVRQRLQVALPVELDAGVHCELFSIKCTGAS